MYLQQLRLSRRCTIIRAVWVLLAVLLSFVTAFQFHCLHETRVSSAPGGDKQIEIL